MSKFLAASEIRHAVQQLGRSSARSRLCEFLIGVRSLKLANADTVALAETVPEFMQALEEFTGWASDDSSVATPYFNPFDRQNPFRKPKFRSNGPSNTIHNWTNQDNSPFEILNTRPRSIRRRQLSPDQLRSFLIQTNQEFNRPRLIDAAVWFYRAVDFGAFSSALPDRARLEAKFIEDLGLAEGDVSALFRREDEDTEADVLDSSYLTGESVALADSAAE